jgi:superfamily II DNA/RNA helicase
MAMAHSLGHARAAGGIAAAAAATIAGGARAWAPVAAAAATAGAGVRSNGGTALGTQGAPFDSISRRHFHCSAATGAAAASASVARTPRRVARAQGAAARSGATTASSSSSHTPPPSTFSALGLPFSVVSAAATVGATVPTPIQSLAIPALLAGRTALLASHTGSGKTLAYLLPIIAQMNRDESERGVRTRLNRPRAIIVVPNRELAVQVLGVAKELSHLGRFRSYASTGFIPLRKLTRALQDPLDLLVVTPGRLEFLLSSQRISLSDTRYVVTDESDTLLSEEHGFADSVQRVLFKPMQERARAREEAAKEAARVARASGIAPATNTPAPAPGVQFVFCSASITPAVENALSRSFPDLVRLHTPSLHHVPENLVMRSIPVRNQDKAELLWELLQHESDSYRRRLMHHRTRAQNKEDIARLGGERQLLEHLVEQDCGERGLPLAAVKASEAAELAEQQQEQEEDEQSEQDLAEDPDAREAHRQPHPEDARLPAVNKRSSTAVPATSSSVTPEVYLPLPPTIIFCNTVSCCRAIAWSLTARGLHVAHYHGLMPAHYRTEHLRSFISGATNILVATDLASRGLDTTFVRHVVHFDFPFHVLDFVHRVGRTARNGQKGKSTALVEKKDRVLADAIEVSPPPQTTTKHTHTISPLFFTLFFFFFLPASYSSCRRLCQDDNFFFLARFPSCFSLPFLRRIFVQSYLQ